MVNEMKYLINIVILFAIGCGSEPNNTLERVVQPGTISVLELTDVSEVVAEKNAYRLSAGQSPLVPGIVCTLHLLPNSTINTPSNPPAAIATWTYEGEFNTSTDVTMILPPAIKALYTNWFMIRCSGQLVVTRSGYHMFSTESDDGSMLYINNSLVVNNDGQHSTQVASGMRLLERGVHAIRIDYFQATGQRALAIRDQDGAISSNRFYR